MKSIYKFSLLFHLKVFHTSIRRTADAPYFVNGLANWWVLSTQCTSISSNFIISRSLALSTPNLRSCVTIELFEPFWRQFTKWSNTLKQFVGNLPTNCLSVFDDFVGLAFKGLNVILVIWYLFYRNCWSCFQSKDLFCHQINKMACICRFCKSHCFWWHWTFSRSF